MDIELISSTSGSHFIVIGSHEASQDKCMD